MLYYVPLEGYRERYSMQWSAPKTGWLERRWREAGVFYRRVEGVRPPSTEPRTIKTGCVLDAVGRSQFCFSQIEELLQLANEGMLTSDDVIQFDDFWHPGLEALPYAFSMFGISPRMYAFLHAQSVDEFDFTYPMRGWMRHFEKGIAEALTGIFVCGPCLRDLVVFGGIAPKEKVHVTGHPFASDEVRERMPHLGTLLPRKNKVVYSSRWDREKNPWFFIEVAKRVLSHRSDVEFVVCSGAPKLRSNDPSLVPMLQEACKQYPGQIVLREGLTKEQYYAELISAKLQMNTADQDFVAITLLESAVAGCYPIYPYFRSFPETFLHKPGFMYERLDVHNAASMILDVLPQEDLWTPKLIESRNWIYSRFDTSWRRMLNVIEGRDINHGTQDPYQE